MIHSIGVPHTCAPFFTTTTSKCVSMTNGAAYMVDGFLYGNGTTCVCGISYQ